MAKQYNFDMIRGDTFEFDVIVSDIGTASVTSIYMSCKQKKTDEDYAFQKSLEDGISDEGDGRFHVRIAPADTADLKPGMYFYDIQIGIDDVDIYTVLTGTLGMSMDVTEETE